MSAFSKKHIISDFSRAAKLYDQHAHIQHAATENLFYISLPHIINSSEIIDLGSGTGSFINLCRHMFPEKRVTALDISLAMCRQAGVKSINADISLLPIKPECFDFIFSSLVFQWVTNIDRTAMEIKRTLKNNGVFALSVFLNGTLREFKESLESCGEENRITNFNSSLYFEEVIKRNGLKLLHSEERIIKTYHNSISDLAYSIKQVGGSNKYPSRATYLTKQNLNSASIFYKNKHSENEKLSASWNIGYFIIKK